MSADRKRVSVRLKFLTISLLVIALVVTGVLSIYHFHILSGGNTGNGETPTEVGMEPAPDAIARELSSDVVFVPSNLKFSKFLVLFFGGSSASPHDYTLVVSHLASALNHRSIGLAFNSRDAIFPFCRDYPSNSNCYEAVRQNQVFGTITDNLSFAIQKGYNITSSELVVTSRLRKILLELKDKYPEDNWSEFLTESRGEDGQIASNVNWNKVLAMGHSHGANIAAYLGSQYQLAGVRHFAGPTDLYADKTVPSYLTGPTRTAKSLWRTYRNQLDWHCDTISAILNATGTLEFGAPYDILKSPSADDQTSEINHYTNDLCGNNLSELLPNDDVPFMTHSNFIQDTWLKNQNRTWSFDLRRLWDEFGRVKECDPNSCVGEFYCNAALGCVRRDQIYQSQNANICECRKP